LRRYTTPGKVVVVTSFRSQRGQASVEFVAAVPAVIIVALIVWQLALAGQAMWLASNAARVGARAASVGQDATGAVRSSLPDSLEHGLQVSRTSDDGVDVGVRIPILVRAWGSPVVIHVRAGLEQKR
jgi:Flp pilus assembly protein TadG